MSEETEKREAEPLDVYTMLAMMLEQMASVAWQKPGLQPDIITGKISRDIAQAKVAVDVTAQLATHLEPNLDEEDRRRVQGLVRDLKLNWVEKNKEVGG